MEHKHAEFFRAIADGTGDEWECDLSGSESGNFVEAMSFAATIAKNPELMKLRRKQKTRVVNGFTVPAPMEVAPKVGESYFLASTSSSYFYAEMMFKKDPFDIHMKRVGNFFSTKEAAIANAKAMLGIDPEEKYE